MKTIEIFSIIGSFGDQGILSLVLNAGPVVKVVLLVLLIFSVISWAIIFTKFAMIRRASKESAIFLEAFWKARDLKEINQAAKSLQASPIAETFSAGYQELTRYRKSRQGESDDEEAGFTGLEVIKRTLRHAASAEVARLEKAVPFLATTGNSAPFIGLFGTVWGIMDSFRSIGEVGSASLAVVAPGISEALVATAMGLFAAIPAVIFYNFFSSRIRVLEVELDNFSGEFLNILERHVSRIQ